MIDDLIQVYFDEKVVDRDQYRNCDYEEFLNDIHLKCKRWNLGATKVQMVIYRYKFHKDMMKT